MAIAPRCPACGSALMPIGPGWGCPVCLQVFPRHLPRPELEAEPEPLPPAHVTGKVIGFRMWTLDGYKLLSGNTALKAYWSIGVNEARCLIDRLEYPGVRPPLRSGHEAPAHDCQCGLYAYHEPIAIGDAWTGDGAIVFGVVSAWGRIEVHPTGFRAQYAEPVILAYHPRQPYEDVKTIEMIASEMAIPLVKVDELPARAREFGEPVALELRPQYLPLANPYLRSMGSGRSVASMPVGGARVGTAMPMGTAMAVRHTSRWQVSVSPPPRKRKPP